MTETIEFAKAVEAAIDWARADVNTLIIVTADHECGGLKVEKNNGAGKLPTVSWSTNDHTAAKVPVYAWGVNAQMAREIKDNTQIFSMLTGKDCTAAGTTVGTAAAAGAVLAVLIAMVVISRHKHKTAKNSQTSSSQS